jgi:hypothetical protein
MFWDDIKEVKESVKLILNGMAGLCSRLSGLELKYKIMVQEQEKAFACFSSCFGKGGKIDELEVKIEFINSLIEMHGEMTRDCVEEVFDCDDEHSSVNRIHDKLDFLLEDSDRQESLVVARKTLDKFDDYMKNVDKLNILANEFKGCVALARSAIEERKELDKQTEETKKLADISQKIYNSMLSFVKAGENIKHEAHFKIDAIYRALCTGQEKKSPKDKKPAKKKASIQPLVS